MLNLLICITIIYIVLVIVNALWVIWFSGIVGKLAFIIIGILVSLINLGVAYHNYTGRYNFFTRILAKTMGWFFK
jgi:hypothetical protein